MASSRMTAPKGRTYDRTVPDGSDLHKHLACRAVPHMSQTLRRLLTFKTVRVTRSIRENLDNAAVLYLAIVALVDHAVEFCPEPDETPDSALDAFELTPGDPTHLLA